MPSVTPIYLDYAATTPLDPQVFEEMKRYFLTDYGNPASLHWAGQAASKAVSQARQTLAETLNVPASQLIFTASATESNNLALKGVFFANSGKRRKILVSAVEHDCVLNSAKWLAKQGAVIDYLNVDRYGRVDLKKLATKLDDETLLVSVIHANNEIGTIQPLSKIIELCHQHGALVHVDASQTMGKLPIDLQELQADFLTASAHKIYGPKGIGLLYHKKSVPLTPLLHGGGQENNLRSSTLNVPGIVGFAKAVELAIANQAEEKSRIQAHRDFLQTQLLNSIEGSYLNGHPVERLYNILNIRFDYIEGEALVMSLSQLGVAASTGSACSSPKLEPSHVLLATGLKPAQAHGSLRLSLGRWTTRAELDQAIVFIKQVVTRLREISPFKIKKG